MYKQLKQFNLLLLYILLQMKYVPIFKHENYDDKIKPALLALTQKKLSIDQVFNVIRKFKILTSYIRKPMNPHQSILTFDTLKKQYKHEIIDVFADLAKVILYAKPEQIKILVQDKEDQINISKRDMMFLMSSMALNLIPFQKYNTPERRSKFCYTTDFNFIFDNQEFKTKTVMEYFKSQLKSYRESKQQFSIRRQVKNDKIQKIIKQKYDLPMAKYEIHSDKASIQEYIGDVKVDFANKFIGGGVLHTGCVQQQIMFANHPQLLTSTLLCEVMNENQALFFTGFKKYSQNHGYGWSTKFAYQQTHIKYQNDNKNRSNQFIVAIDAIHFSKNDTRQFSQKMINRQIGKAYSGFNIPQKLRIITGNWGCGAFNGQVRTKFLIQWLACSLAEKQMIYCPFGSKQKIEENYKVLQKLQKMKVGQVYEKLLKGGDNMYSANNNIFSKISELL